MCPSLFPKQPNPFEDMLKKKIREAVLGDDKHSDDSSKSTGQKVAKKIFQILDDSEKQKRY